MSEPRTMPESVARDLRRYLEIQDSERVLREEKSALQERLGSYLAGQRMNLWTAEVDGQSLKVRRQSVQTVEYNEELLRQRLGDRYPHILAPDPRKIRLHLDEIAPALAPYLEQVGSPQPQAVKAALERGLVAKEEFAGAFHKEIRERVAVSRLRASSTAPDAVEQEEGAE